MLREARHLAQVRRPSEDVLTADYLWTLSKSMSVVVGDPRQQMWNALCICNISLLRFESLIALTVGQLSDQTDDSTEYTLCLAYSKKSHRPSLKQRHVHGNEFLLYANGDAPHGVRHPVHPVAPRVGVAFKAGNNESLGQG